MKRLMLSKEQVKKVAVWWDFNKEFMNVTVQLKDKFQFGARVVNGMELAWESKLEVKEEDIDTITPQGPTIQRER